jgi:uncharacterized RDD family membrane protein YckC
MTQPSGWYDDPNDPTQVRYWDGVVWTDRTSPKLNPNVERSSIGSSSPTETGTGDASQESRGTGRPSPWSAPGQQAGGSHPQGGGPFRQGGDAYRPAPQYGRQGFYAARPTTPDGQPLSGWWRRVVARIVDGIIVALITIPFTFWAYGPVEDSAQRWVDDVLQAARAGSTQTPPIPGDVLRYVAIISAISFVLYGIYEVLLLSRTGSTPGRRLVGISVRLRDQPGPPPVRAMIERYLVKEGPVIVGMLPTIGIFASLFMLVNYLWPLWDPHKQALHGKLVKTNVVLGPQPRRGSRPDGSAAGHH